MVTKNIKFSKLRFREGKAFSYLRLSNFLSDHRWPASYYHFRSTLKRDDFFAYVYFSNLTVLSGYVSRLTNETLAVMFRNCQGSWRHSNMFCSRALRLFRFCRTKVFWPVCREEDEKKFHLNKLTSLEGVTV